MSASRLEQRRAGSGEDGRLAAGGNEDGKRVAVKRKTGTRKWVGEGLKERAMSVAKWKNGLG